MFAPLRTQPTDVAAENLLQLKSVKNDTVKGQPGLKLALTARNTNVSVHLNVVKAHCELPNRAGDAKPLRSVPEQKLDSIRLRTTVLPPNVIDIDEDDLEHLEFSAVYVKDIYEYLFAIESRNSVSPHYLQRHPTLKPHMRVILIEWLVSLQARFKLLQETLLLTVSTLDRYLSTASTEVSRGKFQLVGVSCLLVACKFEEIFLPSVAELAYMCDGAYTPDDIIAMERHILATLQFDFSKPLSAHFLRRFSKAGGADSLTHTIAKYFLELALYNYNVAHCTPSVIAASALFIAGRITQVVSWNETLQFYSRYNPQDLQFVVGELAEAGLTAVANKHLKTTFKKYAADKFQRVAKLVAQSDVVMHLYKQQQQQPQQQLQQQQPPPQQQQQPQLQP